MSKSDVRMLSTSMSATIPDSGKSGSTLMREKRKQKEKKKKKKNTLKQEIFPNMANIHRDDSSGKVCTGEFKGHGGSRSRTQPGGLASSSLYLIYNRFHSG